MNEAIKDFQGAMQSHGIPLPKKIVADGRLHRCRCGCKSKDVKDGWYIFHPDGLPAGAFGCWRCGIRQNWHANLGRELSPAERLALKNKIEAMRRVREAEDEKNKKDASKRAAAIWNSASPASQEHPYLVKKGVRPHGVREHKGRLVVPLRNTKGEIQSLQFINADGDKKFLKAGSVSGCYFGIGKPNGVLCLVEGYATGATIHAATGHAVAIAFNVGNLKPVACALHEKFPDIQLNVCADDDVATAGNPGLTKATEAASAVKGLLAVPEFGPDRAEGLTDFNDLSQSQGLDAVRRCIEAAKPIEHTNTKSGDHQCRVALLNAADVKPEPVKWLWYGWLAEGKLHVLAGAVGTGKTTLTLAMGATLTTGGCWADGTRATAGDVLIWSGEDDPADTIVPRLLACGADLRRVYIVSGVTERDKKRSFDPAYDVDALRRAALESGLDVRLLIVDPIVSAVAADSHKNGEVRRALQPLVDLAGELGCAVLGISHFSKGTAGRDPVERVTGSLAFGALARVVLATAKLPDDATGGNGRLLVRAKSNIGPDSGGYRYELEECEVPGFPDIINTRVMWGVAMDGTARELLAQADAVDDSDEHSALDDAGQFLAELLSSGPMPAKRVLAEAKEAGYAERTIRRAKEDLGIKPVKTRFDGGWEWALPPKMAKEGEDGHAEVLDAFGSSGHLRGKWEAEV